MCFSCGKPGHWRQDCLANKGAYPRINNLKMSTFFVVSPVNKLKMSETQSSVIDYKKVTINGFLVTARLVV